MRPAERRAARRATQQAAPRADILSRLMELISATTEPGEQQQLQNLITVLKMESATLGAAANSRVGEC